MGITHSLRGLMDRAFNLLVYPFKQENELVYSEENTKVLALRNLCDIPNTSRGFKSANLWFVATCVVVLVDELFIRLFP